MLRSINAFILAAGKGTRLNNGQPSPKPKVLYEINGRPMILYTLNTLEKIGFKKPIIIVGYKSELIKKTLKNKKLIFVLQEKQLGTGHAILCAKKYLKNYKDILVLGGDDSAFYHPSTIKRLIKKHLQEKAVITFLTIEHPNPEGLGRIIRDERGKIVAIVEEKEANLVQKKIKEINAGCYCFQTKWLLNNLTKIKLHPQSGEYYITDLIKLAIENGEKVIGLKINNHQEWVGVNTPEQLKLANELMRKRK